jgi:hypothetical protein
MTSAMTAQSQNIHFVRYVDAADASSERNGIQFARLNGRNRLMIATGERNVDVVGTTDVDNVVL